MQPAIFNPNSGLKYNGRGAVAIAPEADRAAQTGGSPPPRRVNGSAQWNRVKKPQIRWRAGPGAFFGLECMVAPQSEEAHLAGLRHITEGTQGLQLLDLRLGDLAAAGGELLNGYKLLASALFHRVQGGVLPQPVDRHERRQ